MTSRAITLWLGALALVLLGAGCSSASSAESDTASESATSCARSAQEVIDRFDRFLAPYVDETPEEFLASPELAGLESFQNDVAAIIVRVATDPNDNCTERDLEKQVDTALQAYAGEGLLKQFLVGVVRQGFEVEKRVVSVSPADDLLALLPLLGAGSSVTFSEGTFVLDATVLVQSDLILVGAGRDATFIESSADTAAIAVLGDGDLVVNDLSVRHVGDVPASVIVAVDASLELVGVGVFGGVTDEDGTGGSGLVLTGTDGAASGAVTVDNSVISAHGAAGIAVTGSLAPTVLNSVIEANEQCGICYFDDGGGQVQSTRFAANGVGLQSSGSSNPDIVANEFVDNIVAGMLIEDDSTPNVLDNRFEGVDIVGVDVQGEAGPVLQRNRFGPHAVAMSLRSMSSVSASQNEIVGGDVAILVGGSASPVVFENTVSGTEVAAILHTETSSGEFSANTFRPNLGAGVVVEGSATPVHAQSTIDGGLVGVVFRQDSGGRFTETTLIGQQVGLEINDGAAPMITDNTFVGSTEAAMILGGHRSVVVRNNLFDEPLEIGIQVGGVGAPTIDANRVHGGDTALLITEASKPLIRDNTFTDQDFGIGVSGTAAPIVENNEIRNAAAGAMSFEGESGGEVRNNRIIDAGVVGVRVAGNAAPTFEANDLFALVQPATSEDTEPEDDGAEDSAAVGQDESDSASVSGAGFLYADAATGTAELNQVFGFVIGIQVSDAAAPDLVANRVDGAGVGGVGILYGLEAAGTAVGNQSINQELGFQLSGSSNPELVGNIIEDAAVVAFLIQGESTAQLTGNTCPAAQVGIVSLEEAAPKLDNNECPVS